jgi:hypothetical protein
MEDFFLYCCEGSCLALVHDGRADVFHAVTSSSHGIGVLFVFYVHLFLLIVLYGGLVASVSSYRFTLWSVE